MRGRIIIGTNAVNRTIITCFYILSHGPLLFLSGFFWDEWALYNQKPDTVAIMFSMAGFPMFGIFHNFILSLSHPAIIYRLIVFFCYLVSGLCLYDIMLRLKCFRIQECMWITLFFIVFPVNSARIAFVTAPYAVCYALFFLGFWYLMKHVDSHNKVDRAIAILLFFFSFSTNSLLVFYTVPITCLAYRERLVFKINGLVLFCRKYADFLLIPFLYFVAKKMIAPPHGIYANYNSISINGLLKGFLSTIKIYYFSFIQVIYKMFVIDNIFLLIVVFASTVLLFRFLRLQKKIHESSAGKLLLIGLVITYLAGYPYYAVGLGPSLDEWNSRHQLLVPLGAAILLAGILQIISRHFSKLQHLQVFLMIILIALMGNQNIKSYISFQQDWYKQASLINNFRESQMIRENDTFVFDDRVRHLNANNRTIRFYEYNGLMKEAFKETSRMGFVPPSGSIKVYQEGTAATVKNNPEYNMSDYKAIFPPQIIRINAGSYDVRPVQQTIALKYLEIFYPSEYEMTVKNITVLQNMGSGD